MKSVYCIALNTYRELVRGKVLYSILFFAAAMLIVSALIGSVTIGDKVKIFKDFGLFVSSFFTVAFAVISGSSLVFKELAKKTIMNILAKPVRRSEFVIGKYFGMLATSLVMLLMMALGLIIFIALFEGASALLLLQAFFTIALQLIIICAAAIFFSSIVVTPMLSGAFTFALFISGRSSEYLLRFIDPENSNPVTKTIAQIFYFLLPHLDAIDVSNQTVYEKFVSLDFLLWSTIYSFSYSIILLTMAVLIFNKREFK